MLHVVRAATVRRIVMAALGLALVAPGLAPPALAGEAPTANEIASGLGLTPAELQAAAGSSLDEIDSRLDRLAPGSGTRGDYSGGNVLNLSSVGAHDRAGVPTCSGWGERAAPGAGNNTWNVYGRHRVDCPPLVTNSWCEIRIYFPRNPEYADTQHSTTGDDDCDVSKWGYGYGWNLSGNMRGLWAAVGTAYWVNNYPDSCESSQFFIICIFHTDFKIPGYGAPWDTFNWAPSGKAWW